MIKLSTEPVSMKIARPLKITHRNLEFSEQLAHNNESYLFDFLNNFTAFMLELIHTRNTNHATMAANIEA